MRLTFRGKLFVIVGTTALAFLVLFVAGTVTSGRTERRLTDIQQRLLPKLELGPRLEAHFERLRRALQDAVAASDHEALNATRKILGELLAEVSSAGPVLTVGQVAALRATIDDYYVTAVDVSRRLISGETGERLVEAMAAMQAKQARVTDLLATATAFDRRELTTTFAEARAVQMAGKRIRLVAILVCMAVVLLLTFWVSRGLIHSLQVVAVGLRRFGQGHFGQPIPAPSDDEIGELARQANQMASSLERAAELRDRNDWIKGALAGLGQELRGELEPAEAAARALTFLARYLDAPAAAIYYLADDGDPGRPTLRLLAGHAVGDAGRGELPERFTLGEGLVGEAALREEITVLRDPPPGYLRIRSVLGESPPRALVLVPLHQLGRPRGMMELAFFREWTQGDRSEEVLLSIRENLVIAIEVARARAATRALLAETQRQAERLREQEDELRANNEELQAQQEELRHSNQALAQQAEELEAQRETLASVSAYKSQFLANMSHELRTPLNSMLLLSNLLAENEPRNLTDKQVEFAKTIHGAGKDLLALINQVLDLSKIEAGKQDIKVEEVAPRRVAEQMRRMFGPLASDKQIEFSVEVGADVPERLPTDARRLEQILTNLIGNAIKFTERGEVKLSMACAESGVLAFSVSDTGVGIAPEDQARIFTPFEQVDGAIDRRYGGTGLGLSIANELAGLLGGELTLSSALGRGSTFVLRLPLAGPASRRPAPAPAPQPFAPARPAGPDASTLLIIEDDQTFADALAEMIRAQALDCLIALDGRSGVRLARERRPAGIVLDLKLPDMDGWQVMAALKDDPRTATIPVHIVSAVKGVDRGLALGAAGYLTKPASREELLQVVASVAPRREGGRRVLVVEDDAVTGDSVAKQLAEDGIEVGRAMNGAEALAALERERFACLVLDLGLPDMDGLTLLEQIRRRQGNHMPSVVVYTGRALSKDEMRTLEVYAETIVLKEGPSAERVRDEVRLFVRRVKDEGPLRGSDGSADAALREVDLAGKKMLVTDDDMRTVYALSATLLGKGAEVFVADTGRAALDMLEEHPDVDAVLMDLMMPELDGYQAIRAIRKDPRFRELVIVALTAKAMKGDREKCLEAGATEYVAKPIDGGRLLMLLHRLLGQRAPRPSSEPDARTSDAR